MWGEFLIRLRYEWNFKGELKIRPAYCRRIKNSPHVAQANYKFAPHIVYLILLVVNFRLYPTLSRIIAPENSNRT
jgi:hypothetical protein